TQREALYYSPYPLLALPQFDPFLGLGILGLLAPAIATISQEGTQMHGSNGMEKQAHREADPG
ncbi:MAG: hypothetical protein PVF04_01075, partial [Anaerolineae bacterium]